MRDVDVVSRYSGNYITVVLPGMTSADATALAQRLRDQLVGLEFTFEDGAAVFPDIFIGVAALSERNHRDAAIVDAAFDALRAAQKEDAGGVYEHTPDTPVTRPVK